MTKHFIWYCLFSCFSNIPITASFIFCAPWLPPNINIVGRPSFNPPLFSIVFLCSEVYSFFSIFTGVPVKTIFFAFGILERASSNDINIVSAFLAKNLTAFPGKALLSCKTTGIFSFFAAQTTGPQIYPPAPTITSGLNCWIIFWAFPVAFNVHIFFWSYLSIISCLIHMLLLFLVHIQLLVPNHFLTLLLFL